MLEIAEFLKVGEWIGGWTVVVLSIIALWRWVIKSLVEKWFQSKLDLQKQEIGSALNVQKEISRQKIEFEKVKLERVLPLLEEINGIINEHRMMHSNFVSAIRKKGGIPNDFEDKRLELDIKFVKALPAIAIYLPKELRALLYQLRSIVSCCFWNEPLKIYYLLLEEGTINSVSDVCSHKNNLYSDLRDCFYDMCNKYLGLSTADESYEEILFRHNFSENIEPTNLNPAKMFFWRFLLIPEYVHPVERDQAIKAIKKAYNVKITG